MLHRAILEYGFLLGYIDLVMLTQEEDEVQSLEIVVVIQSPYLDAGTVQWLHCDWEYSDKEMFGLAMLDGKTPMGP